MRTQRVGQPIDRTRELERAVVVILDERDGRARIHAHVERLILGKSDGHRIFQSFRRHFLAIDRQRAGASFC